MSKVALYRKYRPQVFEDVIGQDMIVKVLTNQVSKGMVSHAYLFTGSRGTGKTSCAKIFARAVNCLTPIGGSPCGKCAVCKSLELPTNLDIIEMDAASNNGVDNIRDLREIIGYMPAYGKYKVYIIDEVHMLSGAAFNALLKTLEEPPAHVVFILCTTESHKLPATILSRCMRFDFRLVPTGALAKLTKSIFEKEKVKADDAAILHIAKLGEGSVRDTLSIADRCMNAGDKLGYEDVLKLTGVSSVEESAELIEYVIRSDVKNILMKVEEMSASGKSISLIARDLMKYTRDLMAVSGGAPQLVSASKDVLGGMTRICTLTDMGFLVRIISALSVVDNELRYSISPKIVLESTLLSLCVLTTSARKPVESEAAAEEVVPPAPEPPAEEKQTTDDVLFDKMNDPDKAVELLGAIHKALRSGDEKYFRLYGEWRSVNTENLRLIGNNFVAYVDKRLHLVLSEQDSFARVQDIISAKGSYKLNIRLLSERNEPDKIAQLLKAAGDAVVILDKKGNKIGRP